MPQETGASGDDADNEQTLKERIEQFERAVIAEALNQTAARSPRRPTGCMSARRRCTKMKRYGLSAKGGALKSKRTAEPACPVVRSVVRKARCAALRAGSGGAQAALPSSAF